MSLSKNLGSRDILLFWEYTLKTIKEIKLVSNPNLSIEMFLIQLMYIIKIYTKNKDETFNRKSSENHQNLKLKNLKNNEPISQIKNIQQEEEKNKKINKETLNNLYDLIQLCADKKDIKLKYELENNVNIVSFSNKSIELSFNDKLNKNFVKDLSEKLYEWTGDRWIILFSKNKGEISVKEKQKNLKKNTIDEYKNSEEYSKIIKNFPDIEIIDIKNKND